MKISPSIVRIKKIESPTSPMEFDEVQLENAAQLILDMEGVVTPLILRRTEPEQEAYTIIDGYFQYYAALKAMEIDSRKGKTINAYVFDSEKEVSFYQQQIELFRQQQSVLTQEASPELPLSEPEPTQETLPEPTLSEESIAKAPSETSSNEEAVINEVSYFASLEKTVNTLVAKNEALEKTVPQLSKANENALHNAVEVIKDLIGEQFQKIGHQIKQEVGKQIHGLSKQINVLQTSIETSGEKRQDNKKPKAPTQDFLDAIEKLSIQVQEFLEAVNTLSSDEFERNLKRVKVDKRVIENIIVEKNKQSFQPFENIVDLLSPRIPRLTEKAMIKILSQWS